MAGSCSASGEAFMDTNISLTTTLLGGNGDLGMALLLADFQHRHLRHLKEFDGRVGIVGG